MHNQYSSISVSKVGLSQHFVANVNGGSVAGKISTEGAKQRTPASTLSSTLNFFKLAKVITARGLFPCSLSSSRHSYSPLAAPGGSTTPRPIAHSQLISTEFSKCTRYYSVWNSTIGNGWDSRRCGGSTAVQASRKRTADCEARSCATSSLNTRAHIAAWKYGNRS